MHLRRPKVVVGHLVWLVWCSLLTCRGSELPFGLPGYSSLTAAEHMVDKHNELELVLASHRVGEAVL